MYVKNGIYDAFKLKSGMCISYLVLDQESYGVAKRIKNYKCEIRRLSLIFYIVSFCIIQNVPFYRRDDFDFEDIFVAIYIIMTS